jgi:hypothetical protein
LVDSVQQYVSYSKLRDGFRRNFDAWHILSNVSSHHLVCSHHLNAGNSADIESEMEKKGRRDRRLKQLLAELKEVTGYWKLIEGALDCPLWRARFERGCGPVLRQTKF